MVKVPEENNMKECIDYIKDICRLHNVDLEASDSDIADLVDDEGIIEFIVKCMGRLKEEGIMDNAEGIMDNAEMICVIDRAVYNSESVIERVQYSCKRESILNKMYGNYIECIENKDMDCYDVARVRYCTEEILNSMHCIYEDTSSIYNIFIDKYDIDSKDIVDRGDYTEIEVGKFGGTIREELKGCENKCIKFRLKGDNSEETVVILYNGNELAIYESGGFVVSIDDTGMSIGLSYKNVSSIINNVPIYHIIKVCVCVLKENCSNRDGVDKARKKEVVDKMQEIGYARVSPDAEEMLGEVFRETIDRYSDNFGIPSNRILFHKARLGAIRKSNSDIRENYAESCVGIIATPDMINKYCKYYSNKFKLVTNSVRDLYYSLGKFTKELLEYANNSGIWFTRMECIDYYYSMQSMGVVCKLEKNRIILNRGILCIVCGIDGSVEIEANKYVEHKERASELVELNLDKTIIAMYGLLSSVAFIIETLGCECISLYEHSIRLDIEPDFSIVANTDDETTIGYYSYYKESIENTEKA